MSHEKSGLVIMAVLLVAPQAGLSKSWVSKKSRNVSLSAVVGIA
jgi:hypothetical protein